MVGTARPKPWHRRASRIVRRARWRGFTLIELLVVLAIMAAFALRPFVNARAAGKWTVVAVELVLPAGQAGDRPH